MLVLNCQKNVRSALYPWRATCYVAVCGIFGIELVKVGCFYLTLLVKISYNLIMVGRVISFLLRIGLIAGIWVLIWRLVEPRTQLMRVLRAALLLLGLLAILAVIRITGQ